MKSIIGSGPQAKIQKPTTSSSIYQSVINCNFRVQNRALALVWEGILKLTFLMLVMV